jgi:tetratricopeptide (TPR) repeat protein
MTLRISKPVFLFALVTAGGAFAQAPPDFRTVFSQGGTAYVQKDWSRCSERFTAAAQAATSDRSAARAFFAAAACLTAGGNKEAAFASLDKAAARGYRDLGRAEGNPELEPLRSDPRWKAFRDGVKTRSDAHETALNAELSRLTAEDQKDREPGADKIDWAVVGKRDAERLKRTREIAAQGGLHQAEDYFNAALILQHSDKTEDYAQAHEWCLKAVELDPELSSARWLAAATQDRWLMNQGKPQHYGTQYKKVNGRWILWDVDPSVTDEERIQWEVPTLAEARKRVEVMNAGTPNPH